MTEPTESVATEPSTGEEAATDPGDIMAEAGGEVWIDLETAEVPEVATPEEPSGTTEGADRAVAEPEAPEEGETLESGEPEAEVPAEKAPEVSEGEGAKEPEPTTTKPFSFGVDGKRVVVPGAFVDEAKGQITIPRDAWQRIIQGRLVDRGAVLQRERALEAQIKDLEPERNQDVIRAREMVRMLDEILASPEEREAFLGDPEASTARLKERLDLATLKAKDERRTVDDQQRQSEQQTDALAHKMADDYPVAIDALFGSVKAQVGVEVPEAVAKAFREEVEDELDRFYFIATKEQATKLGVAEGTLMRDGDRMVKRLAILLKTAGVKANGAPKAPDPVKRDKAAADNRAALGEGPKAPTTPSPKATPAPTAVSTVPDIKSREDWERWKRE